MSDIEYLVGISKKFEGLLASRYDAKGRGLAEKAKDVSSLLPADVFKALRHIAYMRNSVMHDAGVSGIDDRQKLNAMVAIADNHFRAKASGYSSSGFNGSGFGGGANYGYSNNRAHQGGSGPYQHSSQGYSGYRSNHSNNNSSKSSDSSSSYKSHSPSGPIYRMTHSAYLTINNAMVAPFKLLAAKKEQWSNKTMKGAANRKASKNASIKDLKGLPDLISLCQGWIQELNQLPNDSINTLNQKRLSDESIISLWSNATGKRFVLNEDYVKDVNKWLMNMMKAKVVSRDLKLNMKSTFYTTKAPLLMGEQDGEHPSQNIIKTVKRIDRTSGVHFVSYHSYMISMHLESIKVMTVIPQIELKNNKLKVNHDKSEFVIFCPSLDGSLPYKYKDTDQSVPVEPLTLFRINTIDKNLFEKKHSSSSALICEWEKYYGTVFIANEDYINRLNSFLKDAFTSWCKIKATECLSDTGEVSTNSAPINKPYYETDKAAVKNISGQLNRALKRRLARISDIGIDTESNYLVDIEVSAPKLSSKLKISTEKSIIRLSVENHGENKNNE